MIIELEIDDYFFANRNVLAFKMIIATHLYNKHLLNVDSLSKMTGLTKEKFIKELQRYTWSDLRPEFIDNSEECVIFETTMPTDEEVDEINKDLAQNSNSKYNHIMFDEDGNVIDEDEDS